MGDLKVNQLLPETQPPRFPWWPEAEHRQPEPSRVLCPSLVSFSPHLRSATVSWTRLNSGDPCSDLTIQRPSAAALGATQQGSVVRHIRNVHTFAPSELFKKVWQNPGRLGYQLKASVVIATLKKKEEEEECEV